jgi:hypothetical protein
MVIGLGGLFAGILALPPLRDCFEMELLSSAQWFLALISAAIGLAIASVLWRLPQIERLEVPGEAGAEEEPEGLSPAAARTG